MVQIAFFSLHRASIHDGYPLDPDDSVTITWIPGLKSSVHSVLRLSWFVRVKK